LRGLGEHQIHPHTHSDEKYERSKQGLIGEIPNDVNMVIWTSWAPSKIKFFHFFAWIIIKNRLWTMDQLEKRGVAPLGFGGASRLGWVLHT
jgi:hypothetical protein